MRHTLRPCPGTYADAVNFAFFRDNEKPRRTLRSGRQAWPGAHDLPCPPGKAISSQNGQKNKDRNNMDPNSLIVLVVVVLALVVGAVIGARLRRK